MERIEDTEAQRITLIVIPSLGKTNMRKIASKRLSNRLELSVKSYADMLSFIS